MKRILHAAAAAGLALLVGTGTVYAVEYWTGVVVQGCLYIGSGDGTFDFSAVEFTGGEGMVKLQGEDTFLAGGGSPAEGGHLLLKGEREAALWTDTGTLGVAAPGRRWGTSVSVEGNVVMDAGGGTAVTCSPEGSVRFRLANP